MQIFSQPLASFITQECLSQKSSSKRDIDVWNSLLDSVGEGGGMICENGIKTHIISYKKQITSPGSMQDTESLGLVHWDDPEGWYGEGGGRGFRIGNTCTPVEDSC